MQAMQSLIEKLQLQKAKMHLGLNFDEILL